MRRLTAPLVILLLLAITALSGCQNKTAEPAADKAPPESPFSFDFKTDEQDAAFFANSETFDTWLGASPLYGGANPYPNGQMDDFEKARRAKTSAELAAAANDLRVAYLGGRCLGA